MPTKLTRDGAHRLSSFEFVDSNGLEDEDVLLPIASVWDGLCKEGMRFAFSNVNAYRFF